MAVIKDKIISTEQSVLLRGNYYYNIFRRYTLFRQIYKGTNSSITFVGIQK